MTSKRKNPCTNWFPAKVKPVRVGVYRRRIPGLGIRYSWFNGKEWCALAETVEIADRDCNVKSFYQNLCWLGLANDPEKNK